MMTKTQALELLKTAPRNSTPSRVNPSFTTAQATEIVESAIDDSRDGTLSKLMEKRVWQVVKNQKRPRY